MESDFATDLGSLEGPGRTRAIVGYGSLLHPDEVAAEFDDFDPVTVPFRLDGYKRVFNNRSVWRDPERAVLNVEPDSDGWCNGVLVLFRGEALPDNYETREQGYHFEQVTPDVLRPYVQSHRSVIDKLDRIDVPIGDRVEDDIEPLVDYVETCLEGARHWSRALEAHLGAELDGDFLEDFIFTTELADGTPFVEWLERHRGSISTDLRTGFYTAERERS